MSEELYRLIFKGEALEGQHLAVVKKKLLDVLKLDPSRAEKLFSGDAIVIKKSVNKNAAARYQAAFKKAGARLRIVPVPVLVSESVEKAESTPNPSSTPPVDAGEAASFSLAPAGEDLHQDTQSVEAITVDTSYLNMAQSGSDLLSEEYKHIDTTKAPDVSHIDLADIDQLPVSEVPPQVIEIEDPDWDIAEPGEDMLEEHLEIAAAIDIDSIEFELAAAGSVLDQREVADAPPAPDTSQITLKD